MTHPSKDILASISRRLSGKKVALGITGSVAAVKSSEIARLLMRYGVEVFPVMSPEACRLIHPNLMEWSTGNPVVTVLSGAIEHVALGGTTGTRVDAVLIAPATANTIGKIACGIDDTPVTTLATTALGQGIPMILVPAMHEPMYRHPGVIENLARLEGYGVDVLMPRISEGKAKIPEAEEVVFRTISHLRKDGILAGTSWIVSAGRTVEYLDPIRVLTNNSSGKMGMEIARALYLAGAEVEVIYGRGSAREVPGLKIHRADTVEEMSDLVEELLSPGKGKRPKHFDGFVAAAAIGDWKPEQPAEDKISTRREKKLQLSLVPTRKILDQIKQLSPGIFLAAFRALYNKSIEELRDDGIRRMEMAGADMIAVNDVGKAGSGFDVETNELHLFDTRGDYTHLPLTEKFRAAELLVDYMAERISRPG